MDIEAAKKMLAEGNVTAVSHNLVEANRLINQAYQLLKKEAKMKMWSRMNMYLKGMEKACQRILTKIEIAKKMGVNVSVILEKLGYQNETEFRENLLNMIETAHGKVDSIKEALLELQKISQGFWRMNKALTEHMRQHRWGHHESWGSSQSQNQPQEHNQTQSKPGSAWGELGKGGNKGNRQGRP